MLIFAAIVNSALANSNAGVNAASRVIYSLGRQGILPRVFARTHPVHKTPHIAIIAQTIFGLAVALLLGWKYPLITAFSIIATAVTIVVIAVYIIVCMSTIVYFARRPERSPWTHWIIPILGAAVFIPPLYYQYFPLPPYPLRYADWVALGWVVGGVILSALAPRRIVDNADRLFAVEEPVGIAGPSVPPPEPLPA